MASVLPNLPFSLLGLLISSWSGVSIHNSFDILVMILLENSNKQADFYYHSYYVFARHEASFLYFDIHLERFQQLFRLRSMAWSKIYYGFTSSFAWGRRDLGICQNFQPNRIIFTGIRHQHHFAYWSGILTTEKETKYYNVDRHKGVPRRFGGVGRRLRSQVTVNLGHIKISIMFHLNHHRTVPIGTMKCHCLVSDFQYVILNIKMPKNAEN